MSIIVDLKQKKLARVIGIKECDVETDKIKNISKV